MEKQAGLAARLRALKADLRTSAVFGRAAAKAIADEAKEGTLLATVAASRAAGTVVLARDLTFASLLERRARERGRQVFLDFEGTQHTTLDLNERSNRVAAGLARLGARAGEAAAILAPNCPEFLYAFYAIQKLGLTAVPLNVDVRGEGLAYILENSGSRYVFVHHTLLPALEASVPKRGKKGKAAFETIVILEGAPEGARPPEGASSIEGFLAGPGPTPNPGVVPDPEAASLLMYTSGTTGRPKGVVYKYGKTGIKQMRLLGRAFYRADDVLYTCLPLSHANALFLTITVAMAIGARAVLSRRFSASRIWEEVRRSRATTFNCLGAMIPILLKQPLKPNDREHSVRMIISSACPAAAWREFEERFGVKLVEAYGAVDGGGFVSLNLGDAPVGSVGKPLRIFNHKLVDGQGKQVGPGEVGELVFFVGGAKKPVEYHGDRDATESKVRDGWLKTGDLFTRDEAGFLFFAGRNTDSMRRRGENVSALEVEAAVQKHPAVLECAAYGVPSDLGEQDIMVSVVPVEGGRLDPADLHAFLGGKLARYAIPRYVDVVPELPKTETHRVKKKVLETAGVTATAWDAERAGAGKARGAGRG